ncbi:MAG: Rne/Rng family ribonuclease [Actinomycetales bacterium]
MNGETAGETQESAPRTPRRSASRPAGPPQPGPADADAVDQVTRPARKRAAKPDAESPQPGAADGEQGVVEPARAPGRRTRKAAGPADDQPPVDQAVEGATQESAGRGRRAPVMTAFVAPVFVAPPAQSGQAEDDGADEPAPRSRRRRGRSAAEESESVDLPADGSGSEERRLQDREQEDGDEESRRRKRRRGGRRRRRRRLPSDEPNTVVKVRQPRTKSADDTASLKGSTRLEAKKQRRREGREAGRRRAPILTEAEFLARRESVNRVMAVRQQADRTQIAVLEDGVLVEHYVTKAASASASASGPMVGNVYLGRVQNVLPSMEAAFVDIGRGRNAVLYAGEVNWDAAGLDGQPKRIEFALKSGDPVLVQVTKDPVGQKGARLTSQISLPGRFLVYVPDGSMTGISRKLPDTERSRLKSILRRVMPEGAGVIVRTAAEGAPEEALEQDVQRLQAQWENISARAGTANPPTLLSSEPDLAIKVVRDIFNEDVNRLVVSGDTAWPLVHEYVSSVAPDLVDRIEHWVGTEDLFASYRVNEQLAKALDRKVWLPSGGSLVIDRTEAMTVIDVNTGKFTGQGGNLEQTVTRNNLEAAEEIVRQLRLRDIGGIIVVDFIDMVLESNRDLVLRRLVECLGRDRTKHQVAEVTSLGLVQMTRKRIGSGLLESFSVPCEHCAGRGIKVSMTPVDHDHPESPRYRRPANAVDPADVAARALAAAEQRVEVTAAVGLADALTDAGSDIDATEAEAAELVADDEVEAGLAFDLEGIELEHDRSAEDDEDEDDDDSEDDEDEDDDSEDDDDDEDDSEDDDDDDSEDDDEDDKPEPEAPLVRSWPWERRRFDPSP